MNDLQQQSATDPSPQNDPPRGSIAAGIGIAWLIIVPCHALLFLTSLSLFNLLPEILAGIAALVFYNKRRPRTGLGILLGIGSVLAVALLLVAACFGLMVTDHGL